MSQRQTLPERVRHLERVLMELAHRQEFIMRVIQTTVTSGSPLEVSQHREKVTLLDAYARLIAARHAARNQNGGAGAPREEAQSPGDDPRITRPPGAAD